jgi:hypothetical protein
MAISSIPNTVCSFKGLGAIQIGNKLKLVKSSKIEQTLFSEQGHNIIKDNLSSMQARKYLSAFGKYAEKIDLDPTHIYQYSSGKGVAKLQDMTADKSIIKGVKELAKPISTLIKNIFQKVII